MTSPVEERTTTARSEPQRESPTEGCERAYRPLHASPKDMVEAARALAGHHFEVHLKVSTSGVCLNGSPEDVGAVLGVLRRLDRPVLRRTLELKLYRGGTSEVLWTRKVVITVDGSAKKLRLTPEDAEDDLPIHVYVTVVSAVDTESPMRQRPHLIRLRRFFADPGSRPNPHKAPKSHTVTGQLNARSVVLPLTDGHSTPLTLVARALEGGTTISD